MKLELDPARAGALLSSLSSTLQRRPVVSFLGLVLTLPLLAVAGLVTFLVGLSCYRMFTVHISRTDRYAHVPRPKHANNDFPWMGDLSLVRKLRPTEPHIRWTQSLGTSVFTYRGLFYSPRLFLGDTKAMGYILSASNSYSYPKPTPSRLVLQSLLGAGVLVAEGDVHKRQRKVLQPAFGVAAIRELTPFFFKYSEKLAQRIGEMVDLSRQPLASGDEKHGANGVDVAFLHQSEPSRQSSRPGAPVLDVSYWLNQATLDVIGDAGFSHIFNGLDSPYDPAQPTDGEGDVINKSFQQLMKSMSQIGFVRFMQLYLASYPLLGWIQSLPTKRQKAIDTTYAALERVSQEIIERKKREIRGEMAEETRQRTRTGSSAGAGDAASSAIKGITKADFDEKDNLTTTVRDDGTTVASGKDLLHLMMRANMAADVPAREKLNDDELIGQITTLLLAGNETTSTQTTWALLVLAQHPEVQRKLRAEIHDHFGSTMERASVSYDELMTMMPYLDRFCKEMLRYHSPVPSTIRTALKADQIPLSRPYPTRDGRGSFTSVPVAKGQDILIPIQALNLSEELWGPTARDFDPDRWNDDALPESAKKSGLPSHLMTFIAGPRGCIGNRFAVAEFKALLCSLVGRFEFDTVAGWEVEMKQAITLRSRILGQEDLGSQMPLRISRVKV